MSSTPLTAGSRFGSSDAMSSASSLPSSPPSAAISDGASDREQDAMYQEEEKLRKQSEREGKRERERDRKEWEKTAGDENHLKDLDWFLSRSTGFSSTMMDQLKRALEARNVQTTEQPKLVTGGKMRDYQLEGLTWLTCLYQIGLNGILADEMGLGKTIQLISFLAFLREQGTNGPFLVLGPLSTVQNWVNEFARWTPEIPVVMYHGSPQTRAKIRREDMKGDARGSKFPVVCTSYEICMRDKKYLSTYAWKLLVVDEGHRLKNFNCKLVKELKQYPCESRLILTGTPLQNNLAELWSLLNYLLPDAFADLEQFESMFDFSDVQDREGHRQFITQERKTKTVAALHTILKPFLLRRVKADVETNLPKKREYILYAPLTTEQKELYRKIKDNDIRAYLEEKAMERLDSHQSFSTTNGLKRKAGSGPASSNKSVKSSRASTPASGRRAGRRSRKEQMYTEVSDREYFRNLEKSDSSEEIDEEELEEQEHMRNLTLARKEVNQKKLQNPIMQLRLACNSPHHFYWPWPPNADPDHSLIHASGKMTLLDRLVPYLFQHGHKVILFSQFSKQLDILSEWASVLHSWPVCRIDGGVAASDRAAQIEAFNTETDHRLFLLSTRAGGLGINLTAADTVILYDSDWNPQLDLQAQDRAHRIGQTRPVIVYRLATKGTIEQTLLEKADGKRRLEKLVIQKGKFRSLLGGGGGGGGSSANKKGTTAPTDTDELTDLLAAADDDDDFENYSHSFTDEVLTDQDLKVLTDRSDAAFDRAAATAACGKGGGGGGGGGGFGEGEKFRTVEAKTGREGDIMGGLM